MSSESSEYYGVVTRQVCVSWEQINSILILILILISFNLDIVEIAESLLKITIGNANILTSSLKINIGVADISNIYKVD